MRDQEQDLWIWDLARETLRRLTFDPDVDIYPVWTPNSQRVAFTSGRAGSRNLFWKAADGTGTVERLTDNPNRQYPHAFSPDGAQFVIRVNNPETLFDLAVLSMEGDRPTEQILATESNELNPELSPNGRWLAYESDASGQYEIYVRPFPDVNQGLERISTDGGTQPLWGPNAQELFYRSNAGLMVVPIETEPNFAAGSGLFLRVARLEECHELTLTGCTPASGHERRQVRCRFSSPLGHRGAPRQCLSDPFGVVATWRLRHDLADISIHAGSEPTQKLSTWEFGGPDPYLLAARVLHPLRSQPHVLGFARVGMGRADVVKLTSRGAEWADDQRRTELSRIPLSARSHQPRCLALTPGTSTSCSCRSMAGNNTCGEPWMRTATCWTSLSSRDGIDLGAQHANRCLLSIAGAREDILGSADDSTDAD